ncbi:GMC oxidoreductase [Piloderma croceum F 1598]|uniref:GMC oxidoreductase n=1 Tax=Piloderma croceum (strain F 1598) TaxID=765440 RepID=A0A0C3G0X8_PILCF|nr:GMC oxidoreductase [Piloderma croceum F 1598]
MTATINDIADKAFDYVIAGGGTAGLTLAGRLSEDPSISVAVLEAGESNLDDPNITMPGQFGKTFGNSKYDWCHSTTKQKNSNDAVVYWNRGKGLGGSSAMNFYTWSKPPAADVDAIEQLGNPGWNFKEYSKYSLMSETFHPATKDQLASFPHTYISEYRGTSGPIHTTPPPNIPSLEILFQETMINKGLNANRDPYGGDVTGVSSLVSNLDPMTWTRSYSVDYYLRSKHRPNLKVLTEATVARVIFAEAEADQDLTATGLEFLYGGKTYLVKVQKEIIISAGTIKSPQILELSGIGRPDVLTKIGVETKVALSGVGENVQDHISCRFAFELNPQAKHETYDLMRDPEYAAKEMKLFAEGKGHYRRGITSFAFLSLSSANPKDTPALIEKASEEIMAIKKCSNNPGLAEQLDLQQERLINDTRPDIELLCIPNFPTIRALVPPQWQMMPDPEKKYITMAFVLNHPLSRGTVHAKTTDPLDQPEIDPHYFEHDFDLEIMVQGFKYIRSTNVEPWNSDIKQETFPGPTVVTDEDIREFIKDTFNTVWHTMGSCSMLPRDKNGVVNPELKVYGTTNLRVVDISVIPLQIAAHTQATAYMIGEKASDIIRGIVRDA